MTTTTETATIPEGDIMARQTEQARMLREARDELAKRASALAAKKDRKGLERMGIPTERAKELIDGQQFNTEDFSRLLGKKLLTVRGWMAPAGTSVHREMDETAKLLLARILKD